MPAPLTVMHLLPSLHSGGVEQVVLELGEGLSAQGVRNIVVSSGGSMVPKLKEQGSIHYARSIGKKSLFTLREVPRMKRLILKERPNILHLHSRVPAWVGYLAWKMIPADQRPGLVTTFHGFYSVNAYSKIMTRGQRIIAVSGCMRDHILEKYPRTPADIIRVIPNTIDPALDRYGYRPSDAWLREWHTMYPELAGKYTLCLPGRITRLKGHLDLIPILQGLRAAGLPAHAVIVGEVKKGKTAYKEELVRAFDKAGLTSCITWTGHRRDLRNVLCACDVTLSLTHVPESFGKTTLEALALGRPVAGYSHGGVGEQLNVFLPEGNVPPLDTAVMVDTLTQWYTYPPETPREIPPPYRREDMIRAHLDVYRELLPAIPEPEQKTT